MSLTHIPQTGRMKRTSNGCLLLHGFQWSILTLRIPVASQTDDSTTPNTVWQWHTSQYTRQHIWTRLWENISQTLLLAAYVLVFCFLNCMSCFARILHPSWLPSFANFLISSSWNRDNAFSLTFRGPCIISIFWYVSEKMQGYTVYLFLETALHVSGGTSTHHQEHIEQYLQHLALVKP